MIYIIVGPTASGKTNAANKLAEFLDCPIVNADAYQIYKDMDIGTNKILKSDYNYFRYHLLDIITPDENYDVRQYQKAFRDKIKELLKEHKNVVVVGGNGLYIRASIYDYVFIEENDVDQSIYQNCSNEELYAKLMQIDQKSALKIHQNNRKRIIRALNMASNNIKKSDVIDSQKHEYIYPKKSIKILFINPDRKSLYEAINNRVEEMFYLGLINEVKMLIEKYNLSTTAKAAIGYKEVIDYLHNEMSLEECKDLIKQRTRNYAKRQVTFFRHQFETTEYGSYLDLIKGEINHD